MLEWMISSSALIVLVLAVRRLGKSRLSCRARYALWLPVLVRLLVPMQLFTASWGTAAVELPERVTEQGIYVWPTDSTELPASVLTYDGPISENLLDVWTDGHARITDHDGETVTYTHYAAKWSIADIARAVWLTGAGLLAVVLLISNLRFLHRVRRSRIPYALCGGMRVYVADGISSPCLVGVLRPAVYLTSACTQDERALRHVLAHETTHRRHGDCLWSALRLGALCLHWYNPLVWYAVTVSKRDGELACDEATLQRLGESERIAYGETLLALVQAKPDMRETLSASTAMTAGKRTLRERIQAITKRPRTKPAALLLAAAILLASTVFAFSKEGKKDKSEDLQEQGTERASAPVLWEHQGNSSGNLNYGSAAAYNNGVFYYALASEETSEIEKGLLVKAREDGGVAGVLYSGNMPRYLSVADGWIYFSAQTIDGSGCQIYKIRSNGSEMKPLLQEKLPALIRNVTVADGSGFQAVTQPQESDFEPRFAAAGIPSESEVLALRERVTDGMSDGEITHLIQQIMAEHYWWESGYLYNNIFGKLDDSRSLMWNYIDQSGEIQIGWAYDGNIDKDAVCAEEGLTEDEFYARYGKKVVEPNNTRDAESFRKRMIALKASVKSGLLDNDFDRMVELCEQAKETHDVSYAVELYHMLHDMDYYVTRYGLSDVRNFAEGPSIASTYYGCLSVWGN